jgi:hypothetical protein
MIKNQIFQKALLTIVALSTIIFLSACSASDNLLSLDSSTFNAHKIEGNGVIVGDAPILVKTRDGFQCIGL